MIDTSSPIAAVLGGNAKGQKLADAKGLRTVGDLIDFFPRRYLPTGSLTRLNDLKEGDLIVAVGEITRCEEKSYTDRRTGRAAFRVEVSLRTDGQSLSMTFFAKRKHIAEWHQRQMPVGARGIFIGKVKFFGGSPQLTAPQSIMFAADSGPRPVSSDEEGIAAITERPLFPLYPLTAGVDAIDVMRLMGFALDTVEKPVDPLPESIRTSYGVTDLWQAYEWIHRPDELDQVEAAQRRFRFEEALTLQLVLQRRKARLREQAATARTGEAGDMRDRFDAALPFELTPSQRTAGAEIDFDLAQSHPMTRLLHGEVGSGKTLVALRAMLQVVDSGGQAALLAPTEVLAAQHFRSITAMLGDLAGGGLFGGGATVELLTGSMTKSQRAPVLSRIVTGEAGIVIGTHALLHESVQFYDLGLVVVDEQHRFGVEQRSALADQASVTPHTLVMTATPIPRSIAMTVFGDLEVSTLTERPAGAADIATNVVPLAEHPAWESRVWERVREEVAKGRQAYVVAPRINATTAEAAWEETPELDEDGNPIAATRPLEAVEEVATRLADGPLKGLRLAVLHGRLASEQKDSVMRAFAAGDIDVLVSTTVIEVGVDVHNATAMVILDADRFGVSQLHQLRGRVGRGGLPGLCLLVTYADQLSPARERLAAVASTLDGFELSRHDLEQRREGNVLGARQSGGRSSLRNLRVLRDAETITEARAAAETLLASDPDLKAAPDLAAIVIELERSAAADYLERS